MFDVLLHEDWEMKSKNQCNEHEHLRDSSKMNKRQLEMKLESSVHMLVLEVKRLHHNKNSGKIILKGRRTTG